MVVLNESIEHFHLVKFSMHVEFNSYDFRILELPLFISVFRLRKCLKKFRSDEETKLCPSSRLLVWAYENCSKKYLSFWFAMRPIVIINIISSYSIGQIKEFMNLRLNVNCQYFVLYLLYSSTFLPIKFSRWFIAYKFNFAKYKKSFHIMPCTFGQCMYCIFVLN